jgi:hypothetical protein
MPTGSEGSEHIDTTYTVKHIQKGLTLLPMGPARARVGHFDFMAKNLCQVILFMDKKISQNY